MSDPIRELMARATQGPWVRCTASNAPGDGPVVKNEDFFDWVATAQVSNVSNWRDNARLIALAPDLALVASDLADAARHTLALLREGRLRATDPIDPEHPALWQALAAYDALAERAEEPS